METAEVFKIVQFAVPMYTALICGLLLFRMYCRKESPLGRKKMKWVIIACAMSALGWLTLTFYMALPKVFALLNPLVLLLFIGVHVMYYRFIFELTHVRENEKFPIAHYIIPSGAFLVMTIWSCFVPFDVQLELVESRGVWDADYKLYSIFFTSKPLLFFVFDITYAVLGLRRAARFRKVVINYSADEYRISLVWLYQFLFVMLAALPMTAAALFLPKYFIISSGMALLPVAIAMLKDIILTHNVLLENYVIIQHDTLQLEKHQKEALLLEPLGEYDTNSLDAYMRERKPYLNPRLKITDMLVVLNTNRTALSLLINRRYGMNFSRYVNRFRLDELARIKVNPLYAGRNELELIALAGFSDYRGYRRVRDREVIEIEM